MFNKYFFLAIIIALQHNHINATRKKTKGLQSPTIKQEKKNCFIEKKHQCPYPNCTQKCLRKSHLNIHIRSHTGEQPFLCITCNQRFTQSSNLTKHQGTKKHLITFQKYVDDQTKTIPVDEHQHLESPLFQHIDISKDEIESWEKWCQ